MDHELKVGGKKSELVERIVLEHQRLYGDLAGTDGLAAFLTGRPDSTGVEEGMEDTKDDDVTIPIADTRMHTLSQLQQASQRQVTTCTRVCSAAKHPSDQQPRDDPKNGCRPGDTTPLALDVLRTFVPLHVVNSAEYVASGTKLVSASVEILPSFYVAAKAIMTEGLAAAEMVEIDLQAIERLKLPIFDVSTEEQARTHGLKGQYIDLGVSMKEIMLPMVPKDALTGRTYKIRPTTSQGKRLLAIAGNDRMTNPATGQLENFGRWGLWKEAWEAELFDPGSWDSFVQSSITQETHAVEAARAEEEARRSAALRSSGRIRRAPNLPMASEFV